MALSPNGLRAAMKQLQEIRTNPVDGLTLRATDSLAEVEADLVGPVDTPFHGGSFHLVIVLGEGFPEVPPKGYFRTKIFHPNVSEKGEICVNSLKKDWDPSLGLRHVFAVIRCLLIEPNPESALNEEAGRLLLEDYAEYARRARMMTAVHASPAFPSTTAPTASTAADASVTTGGGLRVASASAANAIGGAVPATAAACPAGSAPAVDAGAAQKKAAADKKKAALKRL